jgi:hypothetical protein
VDIRKQVAIERGPQTVVFNMTDFNSTGDKELMIGYESWILTEFWKLFATLTCTTPLVILDITVTLAYVKKVNAGSAGRLLY